MNLKKILQTKPMSFSEALKSNSQKGFTLIELMIVIAILGLLAALVGTNVMSKLEEAKASTTRNQIRQLGVVLDDFRRVCGFYPSTDQGLDALVHAPQGRECKNYDPEGFIKGGHVPKDGWDRDFLYESDGNKYVIKSLGADGQPGGTGRDADISSDDAQ
jgi:general secretion pathway protein G